MLCGMSGGWYIKLFFSVCLCGYFFIGLVVWVVLIFVVLCSDFRFLILFGLFSLVWVMLVSMVNIESKVMSCFFIVNFLFCGLIFGLGWWVV